jgi:hypothetical protein
MPGDAYVAVTDSTHDEFRACDRATYLAIFKL